MGWLLLLGLQLTRGPQGGKKERKGENALGPLRAGMGRGERGEAGIVERCGLREREGRETGLNF